MSTPRFFLHPEGNDQADGRSARVAGNSGPWKTLAGARDALRRLRESGALRGAVEVVLGPGIYEQKEAVFFDERDGETTYRSETPGAAEIRGGEALRGFTETEVHGQRAWVLDLPEAAAGEWHFRSLYVNGARRPRARLPKFSADREGVKRAFRIGEIRRPEPRNLFAGDNYFKPKAGDVEDWPSLPDAEIVLLHYWVETRLLHPHFDPETGWLRTSFRSIFQLYESFDERLARYYIDNLYEALTEPGEWYLDRRTGRLTYLPVDGETLGETEVLAPRLEQFIRVDGSFFNENVDPVDPYWVRPVRGLVFSGITFAISDWHPTLAVMPQHNRLDTIESEVPMAGSVQAAMQVPAALEFRAAESCRIENCHLRLLGLTALHFGEGCRHCAAVGNRIEEVGGGGVKVTGADLDEHPTKRTGFVSVTDNVIRRIGAVFHQGVGVVLGAVFDCEVAHNHIAETAYSGISCGWSWGFRETISRNNRIEWNLIEQIGQGVLSDMGGIYTLGVQPGTVVRHNRIDGVESHDYGGWGIYPDEGSSHILFEGNLVTGTKGTAFRIHYAREVVVCNNVFCGSRTEGLIGIGRATGGVHANCFHNLLIGPSPMLYEGGNFGDITQSIRTDANLIWFPDGEIPRSGNREKREEDVPKNLTFEQWQALGHDCLSVVADPKFQDPANGDFRLAPDSPALKIGFRPVDWSRCGPRKEND